MESVAATRETMAHEKEQYRRVLVLQARRGNDSLIERVLRCTRSEDGQTWPLYSVNVRGTAFTEGSAGALRR